MVFKSLGKKLSSFQIIIIGFLGVILMGTVLLMLPIAVKSGESASIEEALFTATSAVCVTGLVIRDTGIYWSAFGQAVILVLVQAGGLGIISVAAFVAMISGRKISLLQRSMLQDSISAHQLGGIVKMTGFIFKIAIAVETAGALLMMPVFCGQYGVYGIWMSVFHSVSAFCNAGFDIMGDKTGAFSSLTGFRSNLGIVVPICLLIAFGGIGFLTWDDVAENKFRFRRYRMQTKVVLVTTGVLIVVPFALFLFEKNGISAKEHISFALFQAITPRTAGFNTVDLSSLSGAGRLLMILLMLIGGSPGSTAGGIKTTTIAVLLANAMSVFRRKKAIQMFGRRIEDSTVKVAVTVLLMYVFLSFVGAAAISIMDQVPLGDCIFETISAIGTVGLTMGITPSLSFLSHIILIVLMFFGRVGGLTLVYAAVNSKNADVSQRPVEKIIVG